ncbi:MAG: SPOR domain-containing protein, partial [Sedimenticolaceae bacterium]
VVQVGSFSSQENAEKLVEKLREAKLLTPDPDPVDLRGKRYYRVRVGPVVERSEAEAMLEQVNTIAGTRAKVQQYP